MDKRKVEGELFKTDLGKGVFLTEDGTRIFHPTQNYNSGEDLVESVDYPINYPYTSVSPASSIKNEKDKEKVGEFEMVLYISGDDVFLKRKVEDIDEIDGHYYSHFPVVFDSIKSEYSGNPNIPYLFSEKCRNVDEAGNIRNKDITYNYFFESFLSKHEPVVIPKDRLEELVSEGAYFYIDLPIENRHERMPQF